MERFTRIDPEEHQGTVISLSPVLLKLEDLQKVIQDFLICSGFDSINEDLAIQQKGQIIIDENAEYNLFENAGVNCEILKPGSSGWEKGRLRIKAYLEFASDGLEVDETDRDLDNLPKQDTEIEFPLDDVRKEIFNL